MESLSKSRTLSDRLSRLSWTTVQFPPQLSVRALLCLFLGLAVGPYHLFFCHFRVSRTTSLLKDSFWWLTLQKMLMNMFLHVQSMQEVNVVLSLCLVYFRHFPLPVVSDDILLYILSLVHLHHKETLSSWLSNAAYLFLCLNSTWPLKQMTWGPLS